MYSRLIPFVSLLPLFCTMASAAPTSIQNSIGSDPAASSSSSTTPNVARSIYFQTNEVTGENSIVACCVGEDGKIKSHRKIPTGGKGGAGSASNGALIGPDSLFSQNSVIVSGEYLFTVNAGSNSVTMFSINPDSPSDITKVGEPADTIGDFPVALAYSPEIKTLCTVNAGALDGVTCFSVDSKKGLTCLDKEPRRLNTGQTRHEPIGPANTVSDILFSKDGKNLIVFTKGDQMANKSSTIDVFPVKDGKVATTHTRSCIQSSQRISGTIQISDTEFFATDASYGITKLDFNPETGDVCLKPGSQRTIDFQGSTSRIAECKKTGSIYVTDLTMTRIMEYDTKTGDYAGESWTANPPGNLDLAVGGDFLYALSPMNPGYSGFTSAIQIVDIQEKGRPKNLGIYEFSAKDKIGRYSQGLAVYIGKA
ncbi:hypothetical protein ABW19_dt0202660 [Dactylella cylindrospora]|nr:hypothetical protein ABW19_dt0202660 [Dactylella cylindrospora]